MLDWCTTFGTQLLAPVSRARFALDAIPIVDPAKILEDMPDYVLLLPWNFKDEILSQQAEYRRRGGKFIVPVPTPEVIS